MIIQRLNHAWQVPSIIERRHRVLEFWKKGYTNAFIAYHIDYSSRGVEIIKNRLKSDLRFKSKQGGYWSKHGQKPSTAFTEHKYIDYLKEAMRSPEKYHGVNTDRTVPTITNFDLVLEMYRGGKTISETAKRLGVSRSTPEKIRFMLKQEMGVQFYTNKTYYRWLLEELSHLQ